MKPELVIAVGIPASGKSTLRKTRYWDYLIISPDDIRKNVFGVEYDAEIEKDVWEIVFNLLRSNTMKKGNIFFDATSISKWTRKKIIKAVDRRKYNIVAHYMPIKLSSAIDRNGRRKRKVPVEVIRRMADRLEPPSKEEGFKEIRIGPSRSNAQSGGISPPDGTRCLIR